MEAIGDYKTNFLETLRRQLDAFQEQLQEETNERITAADKLEQELYQAQNRNRQDARRIAALEREVAYLRGPNEDYHDHGTQTTPHPFTEAAAQTSNIASSSSKPKSQVDDADIERFHELQRQYAELNEEYGRTENARDKLEVKCRYYKEKLREWSAYSKERYPVENQPQQHKSIRPSETGASRIEGKQLRASSAPTSFITSNGASDPPAPRATSLRAFFNPGDRDQRSWEQLNQQTAEPWQPNCGRTSTLEVDSSVETSDETEDVLGASSRLVGKASISSQGPEKPEASEGSSPILVSTRPVKRKRTRHSSPKLDAIKLPRTEDRPGTAEKPVRIKSDQSSSSPLTAVRFRTLDEHDSVDLDEFGERNYTPRKRQRFDADHIRFSDPTPFHFTRTKALLDDYISNKAKTKTAKGVDTDMDMYNMDPGSPFSSDEDSSIQGDTEHPKPLWKAQPQNKLKRQQDDAEDDRYAQSRENKQETLEAGSKPSKTRKGAIYKDQPDVAGAGWLPTPITSRRYPNLDLNSSRRVEECETPSVLRPTDPNNQILPRTGESNKKRFPLGRRDHGAAAVHLLSEDGDVLDKPSIRDTTRTPRAAEAERRLEGLLSEPSSDKPPLPWETPDVEKKTCSRKADVPTTGAQSGVTVPVKSIATPAAKGIRASEFATPRGKIARSLRPQPPLDKLDLARPTKRSGIAPMSPPKAPTSPGKGPIRLRPLKALQRRHFKLNPANNSGYNYAYREVLRKRNERKCLPGCTRPDCCGDTIRKMLTIGGALPSNLTNLFSSSPEDAETDGAEDHRLLKEYMGDNYRQWRKMSEKEKKEEWMRAQEWNFGKAYGRHKDNGRQATPPGFWRVEMASTQERAKDEEEAEKMERERVEGMWREAMRKGGAYLFADE